MDERQIRKGAVGAIREVHPFDPDAGRKLRQPTESTLRSGGTLLAVADGSRLLAAINRLEIAMIGINMRCAKLRRIGNRSVMIHGDNPRTAAAIAAASGVNDYLAEATPEDELTLIRTGPRRNGGPVMAAAEVG
ncbi:hypothetical protein [Loktanella atrilutea]|nr:hypothetical protein [Loktanella atrilutea]